ncbi:hypothetical protein [Streptomyces sp. NPDC003952]
MDAVLDALRSDRPDLAAERERALYQAVKDFRLSARNVIGV